MYAKHEEMVDAVVDITDVAAVVINVVSLLAEYQMRGPEKYKHGT